MDCDTKNSIEKLRSLRESLCQKQTQWKKAFAVKDAVVIELRSLKVIADNPDSERSDILSKIDCLLSLIDPDHEEFVEKKNV